MVHRKTLALARWDGCRAGSCQEIQWPLCDNNHRATTTALPLGHKDAQIYQQNLQSPGNAPVAESGTKARVNIRDLSRAAKHPVPCKH